jgi:hypothetical protein
VRDPSHDRSGEFVSTFWAEMSAGFLRKHRRERRMLRGCERHSFLWRLTASEPLNNPPIDVCCRKSTAVQCHVANDVGKKPDAVARYSECNWRNRDGELRTTIYTDAGRGARRKATFVCPKGGPHIVEE